MSLDRRILLSPSSDGSDPSSRDSRQIHDSIVIAAASAVSVSLFLVLICCSIFRRRRSPIISPISAADVSSLADADNPLWREKTLGLSASAIESLGSHPHSAADVACPVCLSEIRAGEIVRLLPHCRHVFHVPCVDTWLQSNVTCPLCRTPVQEASDPTVADVAGPQSSDEETRVRVSVEVLERSEGGFRSHSMDSVAMRGFQEGGSSNFEKDVIFEKERTDSGRNSWFSRSGRTKSSSVLPC